ncbi:MAG: ribonuclease III [Treponema sp.]|nr:ribonuclease III [Treponema sp.]
MDDAITAERKIQLREFCERHNLHFRDITLLDLAFHHRSFSNESETHAHVNNERLEFLGDSVLGLVAAAYLYENFKRNPEGDLAHIKSVIVSEKTLASVASAFAIDSMLVLGRGEEKSGGRKKSAILADCMEAIIGAYFIDSGYHAAEKFILSFLVDEIVKVHDKRGAQDYKTLLQELYQKETKTVPRYETVAVTGPDHDSTFSVVVKLGGKVYGTANGKSKKEAEQNAAKNAYKILTQT